MNLKNKLQSKGVKFHQSTKSENEIWMNCCFCEERGHSPDKRFRLGVNIQTGEGHCFNCKWASHDKAVIIIAHKLALGEVESEYQEKEEPKVKVEVALPIDFELLVGKRKDYWFRKAKEYLAIRGITEDQIKSH